MTGDAGSAAPRSHATAVPRARGGACDTLGTSENPRARGRAIGSGAVPMPALRDFPMGRLTVRLLPVIGGAALVVPVAIAIGQGAP
jgi:hypothetical protein